MALCRSWSSRGGSFKAVACANRALLSHREKASKTAVDIIQIIQRRRRRRRRRRALIHKQMSSVKQTWFLRKSGAGCYSATGQNLRVFKVSRVSLSGVHLERGDLVGGDGWVLLLLGQLWLV
jgi:hypothetical protein